MKTKYLRVYILISEQPFLKCGSMKFEEKIGMKTKYPMDYIWISGQLFYKEWHNELKKLVYNKMSHGIFLDLCVPFYKVWYIEMR